MRAVPRASSLHKQALRGMWSSRGLSLPAAAATAARGLHSAKTSRRPSRRRTVALAGAASIAASAAVAHRIERSGRFSAEDGVTAALVAGVRFSRFVPAV